MSKKIYSIILMIVLCFLVVGCTTKPKLALQETQIYLNVGDIYFINPVVTGVEANTEINYYIEDTELLSIEDNCITALSIGNTVVEVSLKDYPDAKASLNVIIEGEPTLTISGPEVVYAEGEVQLEAQAIGIEGELTWYSSNEAIATVDQNGKVKGIKLGKAVITVECGDYSAEFEIIVKRPPEIVITGTNEVIVGGESKLLASLRGLDGKVEWSSSDETILTVDKNGKITGLKEGKATVTAKCGEFSETHEVSVVTAYIEITGSKKLYVGESIQLQANVKGVSSSTSIDYTWESSVDSIAVVSGGKVTGLQEGKVTIMASWNGLKSSIEIDVVLRREVTIDGPNKVDLNDIIELSVETLNVSGEVTWESSDESIATVDKNGVVSGLKIGAVTISATVEGVTGTLEVKVISVTDKVTYYFEGGSSKELYKFESAKGFFELTSYNNNSGSFWSGGYSSNVYLTDRTADPGATFSDRIYIGKNEYTGYYEIKSILTSGGSSWAEGAEYVISISTSYHSYRSIHAQVQKLSVGDVVIIYTDDITAIKTGNICNVGFYNTKLKGSTVTVQKGEFDEKLITPVRLGYEFKGWYNSEGKKVEKLTNEEITGNVKLYAKWDQLNPVVDIKINNVPSEMETDEVFQIEASVNPTDAFFKQVLYYTSDSDIIDVTDEGIITDVN